MRIATILLAAAPLAAQSFDPKLPAPVPPVSGAVVEQATLRYIDIRAGEGKPAAPAKQLTVHYTGWLRDGTQFDSSVGKEPLTFNQGRREVIPGFDTAFEGMKTGGKRRIFIPYQLAYGETGRGKIPPKAELIFDIELVDVKDAPPQQPPAADLLLPLRGLEQKAVNLARAVPEDKLDWRPAPGVRSFKEVFLHIALGNQLMRHIAGGLGGDALQQEIVSNAKAESQPITKDKLIAMLTGSFAELRKEVEEARPAQLNRAIDFFGTPTTTRGVMATIDAHIAEHVGQLIAYSRMNGIVPPWSR